MSTITLDHLSTVGRSGEAASCIKKLTVIAATRNPSIRPFRTLTFVLRPHGCPLCSMMAFLIRQMEGNNDPHAPCSNNAKAMCLVTCNGLPLDFRADTTPTRTVSLRKDERGYVFAIQRTLGGFPMQLLPRPERSNNEVTCHFNNNGTIDAALLSRWIDAFQQMEHDGDCRAPLQMTAEIRTPVSLLIDVDQMCIVDAPADAAYIALSYVWGKVSSWLIAVEANIESLMRPNGLLLQPLPLARSIVDAITLTTQLGRRYLWVDGLCILQDDMTQKLQQLSVMDRIYEHADIVVVAAYGSDANAGLPGISNGSCASERGGTASSMIDKVARLVSISTPQSTAFMDNEWNKRAWTFQESVLAKLKIIFAMNETYLVCECDKSSSESIARQALAAAGDSSSLRLELIPHILKAASNASELDVYRPQLDPWWNYHSLLTSYSYKQMSYPDDVLNAAAAILSRLGRDWNTSFYFGLPTQHFAAALLWTNHADNPDDEVDHVVLGEPARLTS